MSARARPQGALAARAAIAGLVGGIIIDLFLFGTKSAPFPGAYQFIASGLFGKAAFESRWYIAAGVALHLSISIVAALAYAYLGRELHLLHRWLAAGTLFGVVMLIVMQTVMAFAGLSHPLSVRGLATGLIAHVVFFGWPIAYILRPE